MARDLFNRVPSYKQAYEIIPLNKIRFRKEQENRKFPRIMLRNYGLVAVRRHDDG
jgi:hypothetical protein